MDTVFIINARYQADQTLNLVKDLHLQQEVRLEPRLMQVLCLLAEQAGKLVARELLVSEIWKDYGGADDGLTQAISALRKILHDGNKEMIETIPKKGYILHAGISPVQPQLQVSSDKKSRDKQSYFWIAGMALLLLAGFTLLHTLFNSNSPAPVHNPPKMSAGRQNTRVPFEEVNQPAEENYWNTVTTIDADSTKYKLVAIGDSRPRFYINNQLVSPDEMENYLSLINQMKKQLWKRRGK
jgi:DNA-binding winged helix-turn-helix (wHTH) protein